MNNSTNDENLDQLMEVYASEDAVKAAGREKELSEKVLKDVGVLVKGYPAPQRELDLHGKIQVEAMFELDNFIRRSIEHRIRTVRVITGKGLHSRHMISVLPGMTEKSLLEMKRSGKVLTFKKEKSGGAFVVYLIS